MATMESTFFEGKRPWSKIKDQVLGQYIPPYLSKVLRLGKPIILIDAFAGPGKFDDGSAGSPLLMCQAVEKHAKGRCTALFVNNKKSHHETLCHLLAKFMESGTAIPIHGSAQDLLSAVQENLADHTVFLYLDPFGLSGCEFSVIEPFLRRSKTYSTEIVINLSVPVMHRLAARKTVKAGGQDSPRIQKFHHLLTRVLGGDYWRECLLDDTITPGERIERTMSIYRDRMVGLDTVKGFSGSCPVREKLNSKVKYYITFYSRHRDALHLMNDAMCQAYNRRLHEASTDGTLFEDTDWKEMHGTVDLEQLVVQALKSYGAMSRRELWFQLLEDQFMRYTSSEYRSVVRKLVQGTPKLIDFRDIKGTGRLNDESVLLLVDN